jgi:hypothetical protein
MVLRLLGGRVDERPYAMQPGDHRGCWEWLFTLCCDWVGVREHQSAAR